MPYDKAKDDGAEDAPDKTAPPPPFVPPTGTQALLDAQLAEALRIVHDFADWIHSPHANIDRCIPVSYAVGAMMTHVDRETEPRLERVLAEMRSQGRVTAGS